MIRTPDRPRHAPRRLTAPIGSCQGFSDFIETPGFCWGHRGGHTAFVICDDACVSVHRHVRAIDFDSLIEHVASIGMDLPTDLVVLVEGLVLAIIRHRPGEPNDVLRFEHPAELRVV